ncbi:MAG: hypothetical protein AAGF12_22535 [Myxococcota bacterium]
MMIRYGFLVAVATVGTAFSVSAQAPAATPAQESVELPGQRLTRLQEGGSVWTEASFYDQDGQTVVTSEFGAELFLAPGFLLDAQLGLAFVSAGGTDSEAGNFFVGMSHSVRGHNIRFQVGGGIALPTASRQQFSGIRFFPTHAVAQRLRALRELWLYEPDTIGLLPIRASVRSVAEGWIELAARGQVAVIVPVRTEDTFDSMGPASPTVREDDRETVGVFQVEATAALRIADALSVGATLGAVMFAGDVAPATGPDGEVDRFQSSVDLFVRAQLGGFFGRLAFLMALDEPSGFAFDPLGFWSIRMTLGASVEGL